MRNIDHNSDKAQSSWANPHSRQLYSICLENHRETAGKPGGGCQPQKQSRRIDVFCSFKSATWENGIKRASRNAERKTRNRDARVVWGMVVPLLVGDDRSTTDRLTQLSGRGRLSVVKIGHLSVEAGELPVIEIRPLAVKTRELAVEVRNTIVVTPVIGIAIAVVLP